jgi:YggT family protein
MFAIRNLLIALATVIDIALVSLMFITIARAVLSWVSPDPYNPIVRFIHNVTEPILYRIRKRLPMMYGGMDFSPIASDNYLSANIRGREFEGIGRIYGMKRKAGTDQ